MKLQSLQHAFQFPKDFDQYWSTDIDLPSESIDYLGHVTATFYAQIFEEAGLRFLVKIWETPDPSYVNAQVHIHYRREILIQDSPVRVFVSVSDVGQTYFDLTMVIADKNGIGRSATFNHYVAWDRDARQRRDLTESELAALEHNLR